MIKVTYEGNYSNRRKSKSEVPYCNVYMTNGSQKISVACLIKVEKTWCAFCPNTVENVDYTMVEHLGNNIKQVKRTMEQRVKALVTKDNFCAMNLYSFMNLDKVKVYPTDWHDVVWQVTLKQLVLQEEKQS